MDVVNVGALQKEVADLRLRVGNMERELTLLRRNLAILTEIVLASSDLSTTGPEMPRERDPSLGSGRDEDKEPVWEPPEERRRLEDADVFEEERERTQQRVERDRGAEELGPTTDEVLDFRRPEGGADDCWRDELGEEGLDFRKRRDDADDQREETEGEAEADEEYGVMYNQISALLSPKEFDAFVNELRAYKHWEQTLDDTIARVTALFGADRPHLCRRVVAMLKESKCF